MSDALNAEFSVANQFGSFTLKWEEDPLVSISDYLGAYLGMSCTVIEKAGVKGTVRGGLDFRMANYSWQDPGAQNRPASKAGYFDFGIPISLKVEY